MVWSVNWDGAFVVGGDGNRRLTPNFRLKEFMSATGAVRVHRELVSALQILRDAFARPLSIRGTDPDGLGATVEGHPVEDVLRAAERVEAHRLFGEIVRRDGQVHLRIPDPGRRPSIELEQALESAFSVTAGFETSGDRFQQVTGNFDGAGLSFGPAQWNFKSGTLPPLFAAFEARAAAALAACFGDPLDYEEWRRVLALPVAEQIDWANGVSAGRGGHEVAEPWRGYLQAVGRVPAFRVIMVEQALRMYGAKLLREVRYLQSLAPGVEIDHLRCMCALYDLVIQQGSLDKARARIEARVQAEWPRDQFELVRIAVEERGRTAAQAWQADCISRRVGILTGVPVTVDGRQRANLNFFLLRDVHIRDARALLTADLGPRLTAVAQTLAKSGSSLA